jgi:hypothetical protein
MEAAYRSWFNSHYSDELYQEYLGAMNAAHPGAIEFRIAETPVFINSLFRDKMLEACESIIDVITGPHFNDLTAQAIPAAYKIPGDPKHPHFIVFDFGICVNEAGETEPQLVEMQGFPTLFGFQRRMTAVAQEVYQIPATATAYLNGYTAETYTALLRGIIVGENDPSEVILLDLFPHQQKTRIDFYCMKDDLGITPVCITELIPEGNQLFYYKEGRKIQIKRIFNRLIFDELLQQPAGIREKLQLLRDATEVEWITHPDWFYRISKYTLPFIKHRYVPETFFLHELHELPDNLDGYVLKPLFSFAGKGVLIDVTHEDIAQITDPQNWILQRKVNYAAIIQTPGTPAKAEIRIFYCWKDGEPRPVAVQNLARLSKGKMIGVGFNQHETWVGGSLAYFV